MSKKVLIRKQAGGGGIMYTREVGGRGQGGFMQDLAAVRGGAMGLNPQGGQSFIPGAQLGDAKPTGMQRLAAGANLAGRGLAAALTGLQTAYGLQGGNVGALGSVGDTYAQNVQGLTANRPTEAQQTQDMATRAFQSTQAADAQRGMTTALRQAQRAGEAQSVPLPTATPAAPAPATPPADLPTPYVPPADPMQQTLPMGQPAAQPAVQQPPDMTDAAGALASANFNPQQPLTPQQTNDVQAAAQLLGSANVEHEPTRTSGQGEQTPQYSGPMPLQQPAAPAPVVDNGLTPHQGTLPVLMPEQRHEQQRVAVRPPVATPYTPQNTVNPFANPTGEKPGHPYNTGQFAPTQRQYGLSSNVDYRNRAMPANFGGISWDSAVPTLGDDPNINWTEELGKAFAMFVLNDFGDMLHKADPHVAGAVAMRVFLEKMLRK